MKEAGRYLWDVRSPMRDGVRLSVDVHLPPGGTAAGPYPTVLCRTSEGNHQPALVKQARALSEHGFAVALQDVRGREDSDGTFTPFAHEGPDGFDTIAWLGMQEWCTGKVATMGSGYAGWTQWAAAAERPPALVTMVSTAAWTPELSSFPGALPIAMLPWLRAMTGRVWQDPSQVEWGQALWHLPLRDVSSAIGSSLMSWEARLDGTLLPALTGFEAIDVPVLHVLDWCDRAALTLYEAMMRRSPASTDQALVIGPPGDQDGLHAQWLTHWMLEPGAAPPASRFYITGTGTWCQERWDPTRSVPSTLYLRSDGALSPHGPEEETADTFVYDPSDPVVVTHDVLAVAAEDRQFLERRPDVLVFTALPAQSELSLNGIPTVELQVSSDRTDTDIVVQLSDVSPSGRSRAIATGGLRARYRQGTDREVMLVPGEITELTLELSAVAHVVVPGNRLRLSITSSWFPLVDRNLNTGGRIGHETEPLVATNTIHHNATHPSRLLLPVRQESR